MSAISDETATAILGPAWPVLRLEERQPSAGNPRDGSRRMPGGGSGVSSARNQARRAAKRAPAPSVKVPIPTVETCRVYWGSHGCDRPRGHEGDCVCLDCLNDELGNPEWDGYVGMPPYYGPATRFYGEDVEARGLPAVKA